MDLKYSKPQLELVLNKRTWTNWTPTLSASSGGGPTLTLNYAKYYLIGKIIYIDVSVTANPVNSASGRLEFTLPFTPSEADGCVLGSGREATNSGSQLNLRLISGKGAMTLYNTLGFYWVNGATGVVSGQYRVA